VHHHKVNPIILFIKDLERVTSILVNLATGTEAEMNGMGLAMKNLMQLPELIEGVKTLLNPHGTIIVVPHNADTITVVIHSGTHTQLAKGSAGRIIDNQTHCRDLLYILNISDTSLMSTCFLQTFESGKENCC
jgi:hypothetical protein